MRQFLFLLFILFSLDKLFSQPKNETQNSTIKPFELGERLEYKIFWRGMHVGIATLEVGKKLIEQNGAMCYVLRSTAKSTSFFEYIFPVDDKIVSYYDPVLKRTMAGSKHIHEGKFHREYHVEFDYKRNVANWWQNQYKGAKEKIPDDETLRAKAGKTQNIPNNTLDILSAIYFFRENPHPVELGTFFSIPVFDDLQITDLDMKIISEEVLEMNINDILFQIPAFQVRPYLATSGIFRSEGEILIWISNDQKRIPLKIISSISKLGEVQVELYKFTVQEN